MSRNTSNSREWERVIAAVLGGDRHERESARARLWLEVRDHVLHHARLSIGPMADDDEIRRDIAVSVLGALERNDYALLREWMRRSSRERVAPSWWSYLDMITRRAAIDWARGSRQNTARRGAPWQWAAVKPTNPTELTALQDALAAQARFFTEPSLEPRRVAPPRRDGLIDATIQLSVWVAELAGFGERPLVSETRELAATMARDRSLTRNDYEALLSAADMFGAPFAIDDSISSTSHAIEGDRPSAGADDHLREQARGRAVAALQGHTHHVAASAVTPDDQHVVSASVDETLELRERASERAAATLEGHTHHVTASAVALDGQHVVSASVDETLKLWELVSGRAMAALQGHTGSVAACAVTPDGRHVVSASVDGRLKVWELASGRALATLQGHTGSVAACAVTPDGRHLVSASHDRTLKVWELASGRALATLQGHTGRGTACAVTPDGRRVVSASADTTLEVHGGIWLSADASNPDRKPFTTVYSNIAARAAQLRRQLGTRIRALRDARKLTQEVIAGRMGGSPKYVSQLERGQHSPSWETLVAISHHAFDIKVAALMSGIDEDIELEVQELSDMLAGRPREARRNLLHAVWLMLRAGVGSASARNSHPSRESPAAGSSNSNLTDSGHPDHPGASSDRRGPSIPMANRRGKAKEDRPGQKARDPGPAPSGTQPGRDGHGGRRAAKQRPARRC